MELLEKISIHDWHGPFAADITGRIVNALENGKILYAPNLQFELSESERRFLSPQYLDGKSKNISFNAQTEALGGTSCEGLERDALTAMMHRFSLSAARVMRGLCLAYGDHLTPGLTSFRPAQISGRASSWRRDDTRLHVDAFPSRPSQGRRVMRVFANVNPTAAREWRVGEPFEEVARKFLPRVKAPLPGSALLMSAFKITKGRRTAYDHYMLGIHDLMKADARYQAAVRQTPLSFPPGVTWACFTDSVSHAAMSGQHVFEQTFYLPVNSMDDPSLAPLRVLESLTGKPLV